MKKTALLMAFLIGMSFYSVSKAETLAGFLDGNMYDISTGQWRCFYLMDGNCYDVNQNILATRPTSTVPTVVVPPSTPQTNYVPVYIPQNTGANSYTGGSPIVAGNPIVIPLSSITLDKNINFSDQSIYKNHTNQHLASFILTNPNDEQINISKVTIGINGSFPLSEIYNLYLSLNGSDPVFTPTLITNHNSQINSYFSIPKQSDASSVQLDVFADLGNATGTIVTNLGMTGSSSTTHQSIIVNSVTGQTSTIQ